MSHAGDTRHEVVKDVELKGGVELHRFLNGGNCQFSAIYKPGDDKFEIWSCVREDEKNMINEWNTNGWVAWESYEKRRENEQV